MSKVPRTVECKNCEARYKIPETFTAHKITCKRCKHPIFLKNPTSRKKRTTTRRYTRVKGNIKPKKITPLMIASGIGCMVIIAAAIAFFIIKN